MNRRARWVAFGAAILLFALVVSRLLSPPPASEAPLLVYCAAGMRPAVEACVKAYGRAVDLSFGGSQTLLVGAEVSGRGDLLIPGDDSYLRMAREKGLLAETIAVAKMKAVLAVRKGNPKSIRGLADLLRADLKVVLPNPEATASGKLVKAALDKAGRWTEVSARAAVYKPTVNEVANDLKLGSADAGFVWDATVRQYPELEAVMLPELEGVTANISAGVLKSSANPTEALRFARFMASSDRGGPEFERNGYVPAGGDAWEERPSVVLYSGAMLRPAIEKTLEDFERREGCTVSRVYNGCGILVAQMKAGARPDLYFACDQSFMVEVKDLYTAPRDVSVNQLVIMVHKGNPHQVLSLQDLGKPGLRVGIGHEKQCALGALTQETLSQTKLRERVMKNVVVQTPTGDLLVNQLRTGTLDAIVAYLSNAAGAGEALEAIKVDVPCAMATQPIAVGRESTKKQIGSRLVEAILAEPSKGRFLTEGFRWKGSP